VTIAVASLLEQVHYSKQRLGKEVSRKLLRNYLETLDYNHLFLTKEDVDEFTSTWAESLDTEIIFGRTKPAVQMHAVFRQRVEERVAFVKELLATEIDFNSNRSVDLPPEGSVAGCRRRHESNLAGSNHLGNDSRASE